MIAYLAPTKFLPELQAELKNITAVHGNLVLTDGPIQTSVWAQNIWTNAEIIPFESISQAVKALKSRGLLWALYSFDNHRRAQLIQDQLPKLRPRVLNFLDPLPKDPLGAWTLIDKNTLLVSSETNSLFPLGEVAFNEDKETPPSRAYLKLWELFTVYGVRPSKGQRVVDFGSCPGGWTWVLQQMGCDVISIDRAPLDEKIARLPRIEFKKTNAFTVKPSDIGAIDWFFSDIICYPAKLLELVLEWQRSGLCQNFVCTIKFQGGTDFETLKKFQELENAHVVHLHHNKHEVTVWIRKSSKN
ncbi:SAM-dependent methyltransferase [Bdellovibrio sp. HCB185ZH]|uniref:SAM-dependent methyltransferase n=1 Tax=Bdellovibrio sp. HCB185ZH TaxID=3394235 RepID=UPI0039A6608A